MGYFSDQIITKDGMSMFAESLANHTEVVFTRVEIGDGTYSISELSNISATTGLKHQRGSFPVINISTASENIRVRAVITNDNVDTGFFIKEVGVYAKYTDGEEKLVAISITNEDTVFLPKQEGRKVEIPLTDNIAFSGDGNFTIQYTSDAFVLLEEFKEYQEWVNAKLADEYSITKILKAGGTSITFTDEIFQDSSTIDIYTDYYGINPKNAVVSEGKAVLTFKALSHDLQVKVVVK